MDEKYFISVVQEIFQRISKVKNSGISIPSLQIKFSVVVIYLFAKINVKLKYSHDFHRSYMSMTVDKKLSENQIQ